MLGKSVYATALLIAFSSPSRVLYAMPAPMALQSPLSFEVATIKATPPDFRARYMTMQGAHQFLEQFASTLQRAILDRPVLNKTGLTGNYDFDLEWTYDDTQFGGNLPPLASQTSGKPDLFTALQRLGLKLDSSRAAIDTIVIDSVQRPAEN